jgi:hypothetical protein
MRGTNNCRCIKCKPDAAYVPELDGIKAARTGWLSGKADEARNAKADERFK